MRGFKVQMRVNVAGRMGWQQVRWSGLSLPVWGAIIDAIMAGDDTGIVPVGQIEVAGSLYRWQPE